jgi:Na+/melibiose symporter-like transporter
MSDRAHASEFVRLLATIVLALVALAAGAAAVAGTFFLLVNITDRSTDKWGWMMLFASWVVVGAPTCWLCVLGLRALWKAPIRNAT